MFLISDHFRKSLTLIWVRMRTYKIAGVLERPI